MDVQTFWLRGKHTRDSEYSSSYYTHAPSVLSLLVVASSVPQRSLKLFHAQYHARSSLLSLEPSPPLPICKPPNEYIPTNSINMIYRWISARERDMRHEILKREDDDRCGAIPLLLLHSRAPRSLFSLPACLCVLVRVPATCLTRLTRHGYSPPCSTSRGRRLGHWADQQGRRLGARLVGIIVVGICRIGRHRALASFSHCQRWASKLKLSQHGHATWCILGSSQGDRAREREGCQDRFVAD